MRCPVLSLLKKRQVASQRRCVAQPGITLRKLAHADEIQVRLSVLQARDACWTCVNRLDISDSGNTCHVRLPDQQKQAALRAAGAACDNRLSLLAAAADKNHH